MAETPYTSPSGGSKPPNGDRSTFHMGLGKASLDIGGSNVLGIVVVLGLLGLVVGAGYLQMTYVRSAQADHVRLQEEHALMRDHLRESLDEVKFLLSLPEAKRPTLLMPPSLRLKLHNPDWAPPTP